jgi:hypothetical protein
MNDDNRDVIEDMPKARERLHQALNIALDIYEMLANKQIKQGQSLNLITIDKREVEEILTKNKSPPLASLRMRYIITYIGYTISEAVNDKGDLVLCHMWHLAHAIEHIIWDSELPPL